jgi:hypothetical protein
MRAALLPTSLTPSVVQIWTLVGIGNVRQMWLNVIACNLGNLWRPLVLPKKIDNWSLTSLQQRLVKTGGRLVKHARYYWRKDI